MAQQSSTDSRGNLNFPSGLDVRLSVENLQQVASISMDLERLSQQQGVDNSAKIRELENKRAQIFFEALRQQHNVEVNVDTTESTPQPQPAAPRSNARPQRAYDRSGDTSPTYQPQYLHNNYPSTSFANNDYVQQQTPPVRRVYKAAASSYQNVSQPSGGTIYVQTQPAVQRVYENQPNQVIYRQEVSQTPVPVVVRNDGYSSTPVRIVQLAPQSGQGHASSTAAPPTSMVIPRTAAQSARRIEEKRAQRKNKLREHLSALSGRLSSASTETPFAEPLDAMLRLLPFHVYHEPDLSKEALDDFDTLHLRKTIELEEEKKKLFRRFRTLAHKDAMHGSEEYEKTVLSFLDCEFERRALEEDKKSAAEDLRQFVSNSPYCARVKADPQKPPSPRERLDALKKQATATPSKYMGQFEYHHFDERVFPSPQSSVHSSPSKPTPVTSPAMKSPPPPPLTLASTSIPTQQPSPPKAVPVVPAVAALKQPRLRPSWAKSPHVNSTVRPAPQPIASTPSPLNLASTPSQASQSVSPQRAPSPPISKVNSPILQQQQTALPATHLSISTAEANLEDSASDRSCSPELSVYEPPKQLFSSPTKTPAKLEHEERQDQMREPIKLVIHRSRLVKPQEPVNGRHHHHHHRKHKKHKKHKKEKKEKEKKKEKMSEEKLVKVESVNGDEHPRERLVMRIKRSALVSNPSTVPEPEPAASVDVTPPKKLKLKIRLNRSNPDCGLEVVRSESPEQPPEETSQRQGQASAARPNYNFPWTQPDTSLLLAAGQSGFSSFGASASAGTVTASNIQFSPQNEDSDSDHERLCGAADQVLCKLNQWPTMNAQQQSWLPNQHH